MRLCTMTVIVGLICMQPLDVLLLISRAHLTIWITFDMVIDVITVVAPLRDGGVSKLTDIRIRRPYLCTHKLE